MQHKTVGMELVGTANALRRALFEDVWRDFFFVGPTGLQQWFLLYVFEHDDREVYQKDLESVFQIRRSTATEILKSMERKGLILRVPSALDRRSKRIHLTAKACGICEENRRKLVAAEAMMCRGLTPEQLEGFVEILRQIQANIHSF